MTKLKYLYKKLYYIQMNTSDSILDIDFPQATVFLRKLRKQLKRIDKNLSNSITLDINSEKKVMYIRGTTQLELYMWIIYDYIQQIPEIGLVEFKQPFLGLECIQFQFISSDIDVKILDDQKLHDCCKKRLQK